MTDLKSRKNLTVFVSLFVGLLLVSCNNETCSDGVKNQDETGVDCGGVCTACPTCSDGIQNQGETGIDCGGPCSACYTPICSSDQFGATVNGSAYSATYIQTAWQLGNLTISGSNISQHSINLQIDTAWTVGTTYNITGSFGSSNTAGGQYSDLTAGSNLYEATSGSLVITDKNTAHSEISGTFSFNANQTIGGSGSATITSGSFCVNYE